jgi:hypothetical protein
MRLSSAYLLSMGNSCDAMELTSEEQDRVNKRFRKIWMYKYKYYGHYLIIVHICTSKFSTFKG